MAFSRMKIARLFALIAAAQTLSACQVANAPFDAVGRMIQGLGRAFHLGSQATKMPDDFQIDAWEAHDALVHAAPNPVKSEPVIDPTMAGR
jgi:hypothetical protein